ncbi:MAG: FixH family protein [Gammaproteobacteria bacterium]|nr:FixH family protein [Gammaproteobacteria bacterium]MCW8986622.1 FixH family protein [Gammaproteobacteria bacterium]
MTNISAQAAPPPWYKQFWPWFLITFPAIAVVAGIATIILAVQSDDGLVNDNYYKEGLAINQTLDKTQKAHELNLQANADWDKLTQTITLKLSGKLTTLPPRLTMQLAHATRAKQDQSVTLFLSPDKKSYTGRINSVKQGDWILILEPEQKNWRINGRVTLPKQNQWYLNSK